MGSSGSVFLQRLASLLRRSDGAGLMNSFFWTSFPFPENCGIWLTYGPAWEADLGIGMVVALGLCSSFRFFSTYRNDCQCLFFVPYNILKTHWVMGSEGPMWQLREFYVWVTGLEAVVQDLVLNPTVSVIELSGALSHLESGDVHWLCSSTNSSSFLVGDVASKSYETRCWLLFEVDHLNLGAGPVTEYLGGAQWKLCCAL